MRPLFIFCCLNFRLSLSNRPLKPFLKTGRRVALPITILAGESKQGQAHCQYPDKSGHYFEKRVIKIFQHAYFFNDSTNCFSSTF